MSNNSARRLRRQRDRQLKKQRASRPDFLDWMLAGIKGDNVVAKAARHAIRHFGDSIRLLADSLRDMRGRGLTSAAMLADVRDGVDEILSFRSGGTACAKGCHYCCFHEVDCLRGEARVIADRIKDDEEAKHRIRTYAAGQGKRLCPLNVGGECGVYEVRPFACRGYNSGDSKACRRFDETGIGTIPVNLGVYAVALFPSIAAELYRPSDDWETVQLVPELVRLLTTDEDSTALAN